MSDKRELTHADLKMLAAAVSEVWPELAESRTTQELIADWRLLLDRFKLETTERKNKKGQS